MPYCTNFDVFNNGKVIANGRNTACYHQYFRTLPKADQVLVYVRHKYPAGYTAHPPRITREELERYIHLLNKIGMKCTLTDGEVDLEGKGVKEPVLVFALNPTKNSPLVTLLLAHAIRDIYEGSLDEIIKAFLKFADDPVKGINLYNRYIIARMCEPYIANGHSFFPSKLGSYGPSLFALLTLPEVTEKVLNNKGAESVSSSIPQVSATTYHETVRDKMGRAYRKGASLVELYKLYKSHFKCTKKSQPSAGTSVSASIHKEKVLA